MARLGVTIELDRPRTMRYGINALIRVEESLGAKITSLDLEHLGITELIKIVHAGLAEDDPTLTIAKLGDLIDEYSSIEAVAKAMGEAIEEAFGPKPGAPRGIAAAQ